MRKAKKTVPYLSLLFVVMIVLIIGYTQLDGERRTRFFSGIAAFAFMVGGFLFLMWIRSAVRREGRSIAGVLERADPRDAFLSKTSSSLMDLAPGDTVGTSSLRRRAQLRRINPGAIAVDMRGNIDTRLRKLRDGYCSGIILAAAGLGRAGLTDHITEYMRMEDMLPAPAQGTIGLETRVDDDNAQYVVDSLNHDATWAAAVAERSFLREVEGGCQIPIGCFAAVVGNSIDITGLISDIEGTRWVKRSTKGPVEKSPDLGAKLAGEMLDDGGREILEIVRNGNI